MTMEVTQAEHIELQLRALEKEAANTLWTGSSLLKGHALLVREALTATAALEAENAALRAELNEQARIVGMSAERELTLRAENAAMRERVAALVHTARDLLQHVDWLTNGLPELLDHAALSDEEGLIGAATDAANSARQALGQPHD